VLGARSDSIGGKRGCKAVDFAFNVGHGHFAKRPLTTACFTSRSPGPRNRRAAFLLTGDLRYWTRRKLFDAAYRGALGRVRFDGWRDVCERPASHRLLSIGEA